MSSETASENFHHQWLHICTIYYNMLQKHYALFITHFQGMVNGTKVQNCCRFVQQVSKTESKVGSYIFIYLVLLPSFRTSTNQKLIRLGQFSRYDMYTLCLKTPFYYCSNKINAEPIVFIWVQKFCQ